MLCQGGKGRKQGVRLKRRDFGIAGLDPAAKCRGQFVGLEMGAKRAPFGLMRELQMTVEAGYPTAGGACQPERRGRLNQRYLKRPGTKVVTGPAKVTGGFASGADELGHKGRGWAGADVLRFANLLDPAPRI